MSSYSLPLWFFFLFSIFYELISFLFFIFSLFFSLFIVIILWPHFRHVFTDWSSLSLSNRFATCKVVEPFKGTVQQSSTKDRNPIHVLVAKKQIIFFLAFILGGKTAASAAPSLLKLERP